MMEVAAAGDMGEEEVPPEHLFSDYIEITYLGAVISAGLALNFCVLRMLLREKRLLDRGGRQKNGFLLLKINLNVSDLLILLIHALGKFAWLITYEWQGGEMLCRLFNFLSMFTLYLSSNIVICIALDRLMTVLKAQKVNVGQRKLNIVRAMLFLAWSCSLLFSLPQLVVWTTYNPFRHSRSQGWVQCTDIWSIDKYERYLEEQEAGRGGDKTPKEMMISAARDAWTEFVLGSAVQNGYELVHLFLVFYGPLIVLVSCYAIISTRLIQFAANNPRMAAASSQYQTSYHEPVNAAAPPMIANGAECCYSSKRASIKSFPAIKLYGCTFDEMRRRRSHHHPSTPVPMIDIREVSSRAEEAASSSVMEQQQQQFTTTNSSVSEGKHDDAAAKEQREHVKDNDDEVVRLNGTTTGANGGFPPTRLHHFKTSKSLPETGAIRMVHVANNIPSNRNSSSSSGANLLNSNDLHSTTNSSIANGAAALPPNGNNKRHQQPCMLTRMQNSIRQSVFAQRFGHYHQRDCRQHPQLSANLMLHCSSTSLGVGGGGTAEADDEVQQQQQRLDQMEMAQQKRGNKQLLTTTTTTTTEKKKDATRLMLLFHLPLHVVQQLWHRGRMAFGSKAAEQQQPQRHVWHSSAGTLADEEEEEAQEADDEATTTEEGGGGGQADGLLLEQQHRPGATAGIAPPPSSPNPYSAAAAVRRHVWQQQQNKWRCQSGGGGNGTPPTTANNNNTTITHSASFRSSISTSTITHGPQHASNTLRERVLPLWRRHIHSRAFRATLLVILAHVLLWSPYNVYALMKHVNVRMYEQMSEQANVLKDLQFLIVLINPFLYGFRHKVVHKGVGIGNKAAAARRRDSRDKHRQQQQQHK